MEAINKLVAFIENPSTNEEDRKKALSTLNLQGTPSAEIEELAYAHWQNYFAENMEEILSDKLVIVSHLLSDKTVNECFEDAFEEYKNRRKQMGVDDIQKFGYSGF